ncbi:MAG TPA: prephenate dehydrogenase/arogenate dehydrogenase family protein [Thermoanaerobaculia bacterium]
MHSAPRALIAGLGLIGGSIGMALRSRGWHVTFVDPNVDLHPAQRAGAADERVDSLRADADVIIIATPLNVAVELLRTQDSGLRTTSVTSVMEPLRAAAKNTNFIAGHPLAGSHERGLAAAHADLLRDRVWFLERHDELVDRVVNDCGARLEIVSADEHDAAVALTSHLPQILSTALAAYLDQDSERRAAGGGRELRDFVGTGLETFLRLASSDASVWSPVFKANRANVTPHVEALLNIVWKILDGDKSAFEQARAFMGKLKA